MINLGYIGISIILLAFLILNTKWSKYFLVIDMVGTLFLFGYAIEILDWIFIISQGMIIIFLISKMIKGGVR